jgi:hypothetical protein
MFTVEFEPDASVIVSMDNTGEFDDVEVIIGDDGHVYLRQYDEDVGGFEMLLMTYTQLIQIFAALQSSEGAYILERQEKKQHDIY